MAKLFFRKIIIYFYICINISIYIFTTISSIKTVCRNNEIILLHDTNRFIINRPIDITIINN